MRQRYYVESTLLVDLGRNARPPSAGYSYLPLCKTAAWLHLHLQLAIICLLITTESTHDNEENEVDPVPEGVSILNVIHNVHPSLQADHLSHTCFGINRHRLT